MARRKSKHAQWQRELTKDEIDSITDYTGGGYYDINGYLRRSVNLSELNLVKEKFLVQNLGSAIEKYTLKEGIVVQRGTTTTSIYELCEKNGITDDLKELVEKTYHDDGFMSSSALFGNPVATTKDVVLEISIPPGKGKGAYVNQLSGFQDAEYEFLIKRNSDFEISDVEEDINTGKVYIKMVMR